LIAHYELPAAEGQLAYDEVAVSEQEGQTVITVPATLLPVIQQLLASAENP